MEEKIKQIMSDIFFINTSDITENSSQDTIENWDSIGNLNLVTALEEEFEILFTDDQIIEMLNFKLVCEITKEAILNKS
jgi:acyl carrier protein